MSQNSKKFIIICILAVAFSGVLFQSVLTANVGDAINVLDTKVVPQTDITKTDIPSGDLAEAAGFWIKIVLGTVGVIFFILIFYAAFRWMTSRGEEDALKTARNTLKASIIGLLIVVSSYAITSIVITRLVDQESQVGSVTAGPKG